jgi:acyl-coenzyme A thioesterase PaaI-like protein
MIVESCENRWAMLRLDVDHNHLCPGVTVYGPTMMLIADTEIYTTILTTMSAVVLAVTTNLNINFLRNTEPYCDFLGDSWLMKVGKRLIVGDVIIYSQDDPEPVSHETCTYFHFSTIQTNKS